MCKMSEEAARILAQARKANPILEGNLVEIEERMMAAQTHPQLKVDPNKSKRQRFFEMYGGTSVSQK